MRAVGKERDSRREGGREVEWVGRALGEGQTEGETENEKRHT